MGKFKMKGFNAGKGTGSAKTHLRQMEVELNQGPELYSGEIPGGPGYISQDDPRHYEMMYPGGTYGGTASEISPGSQVRSTMERTMDKRASGESTVLTPGSSGVYSPDGDREYHERYHGIKDETAGYDKYTLGAPNKKEKQERKRFQSDLGNALKNYKGKLPIADWEINDENFDYWAQINNIDPVDKKHDPRIYDQFVSNVEQVNNLSNESKLAAQAGYKPWHSGPPNTIHPIDWESGDYAIDKNKQYINLKNSENATKSKRNRKSDTLRAELEDWMDDGGTLSEWLGTRGYDSEKIERLKGGTPSKLSHGARVDTETIANNTKWIDALIEEDKMANMTWSEKRKYKNEKEKEEQKRIQEQKDIEANLPKEGSAEELAELEWMDTAEGQEDPWAYPGSAIGDQVEEGEQQEGEFDPMDMNKDGYVDKWDRKDYAKMMAEQGPTEEQTMTEPEPPAIEEEPVVEEEPVAEEPVAEEPVTEEPVVEEKTPKPKEHIEHEEKVEKAIASSEGLEGDWNKDGVVDYLDKRYAPMSKRVDYTQPNPFQRGSDEYYKWQRGKVGHRNGLTKKMFNMYSK